LGTGEEGKSPPYPIITLFVIGKGRGKGQAVELFLINLHGGGKKPTEGKSGWENTTIQFWKATKRNGKPGRKTPPLQKKINGKKGGK